MITIRTKHDDAYQGNPQIRPGFYWARILDYEESETANKDPMFILTVGVYAKPDHEKKHLHQEVKMYQSITEKSQWRTERLLATLGCKFGQNQDIVIRRDMFVGKTVAVRTSMKPGKNGGFFTQIDEIMARGKEPHTGEFMPDEWKEFKLDAYGVRNGTGIYNNASTDQSAYVRQVQQHPTAPAADPYPVEDDDFVF